MKKYSVEVLSLRKREIVLVHFDSRSMTTKAEKKLAKHILKVFKKSLPRKVSVITLPYTEA